MRAVSLFIARADGIDQSVPAWIVDGTDDTMAVDERYPAEPQFKEPAIYAITHIPSGRRLRHGRDTSASTLLEAIRIAYGFYQQATEIGMNLKATEFDTIVARYKELSDIQLLQFWHAVKEA